LTVSQDFYDRQRDAEHEIATIGIAKSSDSGRLFEEFAKRFSLLSKPVRPPGSGLQPVASILSIAQAGGGDSHELVFLLLCLFKWSGFECESIEIYENSKFDTRPEHILVYLPALDRYFDPTLQVAKQLEGSGVKWPKERPRVHRPHPLGGEAWAFRGSSSEPTQ
jgi:hypothetical protein